MRYSMLVYLKNMSGTLLEAAQYLRTAKDDALRTELLDNGQEMLARMKDALAKHGADLKSTLPINLLEDIMRLWSDVGKNQQLEDLLTRFADILPKEVCYQVRAVFFAELGEKWDSMESVYAYMRDDPRFDPVVVLTPVFRVVQRDGKKVQDVIYKDYLTPLGIPFFEYNEYSLEEDCPDLAFICQPYESCTLPQFWPENIAKYTRLVYLPYYLPSVGNSDNRDRLCRLPVFDVAWRVLGANEKHFNFYWEHSRHNGRNMMVTGLPKLDHIVKLRKKPFSPPIGWEKLRNKKIIFLWNTWYSISASSIQYFDDIIAWFECHKDCALIWRPHPMTNTITKLYRPDAYDSIQKHYEIVDASFNMLIDHEVSYDAAFYFSDALISDVSSMRQQYLLLDKPILTIVAEGRFSAHSKSTLFWEAGWSDYAWNQKDIFDFMEQTYQGEDKSKFVRQEILRTDLSLADGVCGERVCCILWNEMHKEDGVSTVNV